MYIPGEGHRIVPSDRGLIRATSRLHTTHLQFILFFWFYSFLTWICCWCCFERLNLLLLLLFNLDALLLLLLLLFFNPSSFPSSFWVSVGSLHKQLGRQSKKWFFLEWYKSSGFLWKNPFFMLETSNLSLVKDLAKTRLSSITQLNIQHLRCSKRHTLNSNPSDMAVCALGDMLR